MSTGESTKSGPIETGGDIEEMVLSATNEALEEAGAPFDQSEDHTITAVVKIEVQEV
jgi:hypothetical protein